MFSLNKACLAFSLLFFYVALFAMENGTNSNELKPFFVANIPTYVDSDQESTDSECEEDNEDYKFSNEDFEHPPYFINYEKRGAIGEVFEPSYKNHSSKPAEIVNSLCKKLQSESGLLNKSELAMVFCLNHPHSLSSKKNKKLTQEINKPIEEQSRVRVFGLFWHYPWERIKKTKERTRGNPPTQKEIQSYYDQLKKYDPKKARIFRRNNENKAINESPCPKNRMVPYREIREQIKDSKQTQELVNNARQKNFRPIYLFFCDKDTVNFNGCLASYSKLAIQSNTPSIHAMSTGYEYSNCDNHPMIRLASKLDMIVRHTTAQHIPLGVYYPEPNLCILVPDNQNTICETFKKKEHDYSSPQESAIILNQVATRKPQGTISFLLENSLLTNTPQRATEYKTRTKKGTHNLLIFEATLDSNSNKFDDWTMHDLVNITTNCAQSHASPRNWAVNVLNAFELDITPSCLKKKKKEKEILINGTKYTIESPIGNTVRNIAISLLSRLFKSYDPIKLANEKKSSLISILKAYPEAIKTDTIPPVKEGKRSQNKQLWDRIDNIQSRSELVQLLPLFLKECKPESINLAAKDCGNATCNFLKEHLALS